RCPKLQAEGLRRREATPGSGIIIVLDQTLRDAYPRNGIPFYEYRCTACGHKLEALQKFTESPLKDCPACGKSRLIKLVSLAGFQLKGSGWYATDFKGSGAK